VRVKSIRVVLCLWLCCFRFVNFVCLLVLSVFKTTQTGEITITLERYHRHLFVRFVLLFQLLVFLVIFQNFNKQNHEETGPINYIHTCLSTCTRIVYQTSACQEITQRHIASFYQVNGYEELSWIPNHHCMYN